MSAPEASQASELESSVVPSIALEEVTVLAPAEREALLASLQAAEERLKAGQSAVYDRAEQRRRFEKIYNRRT